MIDEATHTENQDSPEPGQEYPRPESGEVFLHLPGLRNAPPLGGGCCAMTAVDAVRDELDSWPTITVTELDVDAERVTVGIDPAGDDQVADAVEALRDLGLQHITIVRGG